MQPYQNDTTQECSELTDREVFEITCNARHVGTDDERFSDNTGGLLPVADIIISSLLASSKLSHWTNDGETKTVVKEWDKITFEGQGDGLIRFEIECDSETKEIESLTVNAELV